MRKAFENIKRITLRSKKYRVVLAARLGPDDHPVMGDCSDPNRTGKTIRYYMGLKGERRLDVLIHEMLHACFWDISEESVEESATDIARALWRVGYHMNDEEGYHGNLPQFMLFRGKRYKYERKAGLKTGTNGIVSHPLDNNKIFQIRTSLKGENELCQHIKYMLYICLWDFDNEAINQSAKDIARALTRMGYAKEFPEE